MHPPSRIGITLGDATGIGPEVAIKALSRLTQETERRFALLGDADQIALANSNARLRIVPAARATDGDRIISIDPCPTPLPRRLTAGDPAAALAAVDWLREGARRCLDEDLAALVTAPVNKHAIVQSGVDFIGQTEFLSRLANAKKAGMMLLAPDERERWLRVMLVTTHLPLRRVPDAITQESVLRACELGDLACKQLGLREARLGVAGLNPHAGENGMMGREEIEVIVPAMKVAKSQGMNVAGPIPADTLFYQALRGDFDVVISMYHDQGLGPLKMIGFERGVNWTVGLPFIRTSPDHGTAYDIAGKDQADPSSMIAAIRLAIQLSAKAAPRRVLERGAPRLSEFH